MTMNQIQYNPEDYELLKTQEMDNELVFKLVKFSTGHYGILTYNPIIDAEKVILLSSDKDEFIGDSKLPGLIFGGAACHSFLVFAEQAKKYAEEAPMELVVNLGTDAAEEYREVITREQAKTLYEKVEIYYEIMNMKMEDSFIYPHGDTIQVVLICFTVVMVGVAIMNTLHGMI